MHSALQLYPLTVQQYCGEEVIFTIPISYYFFCGLLHILLSLNSFHNAVSWSHVNDALKLKFGLCTRVNSLIKLINFKTDFTAPGF